MTAAACSPTRSRKRWCSGLKASASAWYTASAPMHSSLKASGVTSAARRRDSPATSPTTKSRPASPLRSAWRSRTAQPTLPAPSGSISSRSIAASTPLASAQRTELAPSTLRNSAQAEYGTSAPRREATRVKVSATPRLRPIDCAIS